MHTGQAEAAEMLPEVMLPKRSQRLEARQLAVRQGIESQRNEQLSLNYITYETYITFQCIYH